MPASIRKNFVFDKGVVAQLEALAHSRQQSQTAVIQDLIKESARDIEREKRLKAFHSLIGSLNGKLGEQTIQSIKGSSRV